MSRNSNSQKQVKANIEIVAQREELACDPADASTSQSRQLVSLMHRLAPRRFDRTREMIFRLEGFVEIFTALQPVDDYAETQDCNDCSVDIKP